MNPQALAPVDLPPALERAAVRAWLALAVTFVAAMFPFPARFATVAFALVALLLMTVALWHTTGVTQAAPLRMVLWFGAVASTGFLVFGGSWVIVAPETTAHEACIAAAITPTARQTCDQDYLAAVYGKFGQEVPDLNP